MVGPGVCEYCLLSAGCLSIRAYTDISTITNRYFSDAVKNEANRKTFVANILAIYTEFNLDGIDIDWEYPGTQGSSDNIVSSSDSANFLLFLNLLRSTLPSDAILSAAVGVLPFAGSDGSAMSDVSGFAGVLDWVLVMNYDVWGCESIFLFWISRQTQMLITVSYRSTLSPLASSTPGPNAPLSDGCGDSLQPLANAYAAVSSWTSAGMPASQIMLGIPAYGYLQMSTATALVDRRRSDKVTVQNGDGGTTDGQLQFDSLVSQGALTLASNGTYMGSGGFVREWDSCSSTVSFYSTNRTNKEADVSLFPTTALVEISIYRPDSNL